jgi:hypothetical protein
MGYLESLEEDIDNLKLAVRALVELLPDDKRNQVLNVPAVREAWDEYTNADSIIDVCNKPPAEPPEVEPIYSYPFVETYFNHGRDPEQPPCPMAIWDGTHWRVHPEEWEMLLSWVLENEFCLESHASDPVQIDIDNGFYVYAKGAPATCTIIDIPGAKPDGKGRWVANTPIA